MTKPTLRNLAVRRQLLVMQAQLRRLQLQIDVREWRAASSPLTQLERWALAARRGPLATLLTNAALATLRSWMGGRPR